MLHLSDIAVTPLKAINLLASTPCSRHDITPLIVLSHSAQKYFYYYAMCAARGRGRPHAGEIAAPRALALAAGQIHLANLLMDAIKYRVVVLGRCTGAIPGRGKLVHVGVIEQPRRAHRRQRKQRAGHSHCRCDAEGLLQHECSLWGCFECDCFRCATGEKDKKIERAHAYIGAASSVRGAAHSGVAVQDRQIVNHSEPVMQWCVHDAWYSRQIRSRSNDDAGDERGAVAQQLGHDSVDELERDVGTATCEPTRV